jgi:presenilin-like A22 family membrane protease
MKHSVTITIILLIFFMISQIVGLFVISKYIDVPKSMEAGSIEHKALPYNMQPPQMDKDYSFVYVFISILIGTAIIMLLIRYMQFMLWKLWYFFAIFFSLLISFAAFLGETYAVIVAFIFALLKTFRPSVIVHNFTELFVYGGLAAFFVWLFNLKSAMILLILISLYDMYAVWGSKHMIKLAKAQAKSQMFAGLFIPYHLGSMGQGAAPKGAKVVKTKVRNAILGGGDIAFPLIFAGTVLETAVLKYPIGEALIRTMLIPLFATIALALLFYKSEEKKFYPAMPFLTAGCFIGYLIYVLI